MGFGTGWFELLARVPWAVLIAPLPLAACCVPRGTLAAGRSYRDVIIGPLLKGPRSRFR